MNYWSCENCSFVSKSEEPPEKCPSCGKKCVFSDVTCYIPECGGPNNIDYGLLGEKMSHRKQDGG